MSTTILNEHDANQGAQSKGEFLGMSGNSGWYLLGSAGMTVMMVIVLWGVFGVSLLLCVLLGVVLCLLSVAYVFTLKNNKPDHYDTDFFESALVEAGVLELVFGPRSRRAANPFKERGVDDTETAAANRRSHANTTERRSSAGARTVMRLGPATLEQPSTPVQKSNGATNEREPVIALAAYEKLQADLLDAEDRLEEAIMAREEES